METMTAEEYRATLKGADVAKLLEIQRERERQEDEAPKRHNGHPEADLQAQCLQWFRLQYPKLAPLLFAVENGAKKERRYVNGRWVCLDGVNSKKTGVVSGVADLLLLIPRGGFGCLCIEMKTTDRRSRQSDRQKAWQKAAEEAGNKYVIVRTLEQFQRVVNQYLALR